MVSNKPETQEQKAKVRIPKLWVTKDVIARMCEEALRFRKIETSWGVWGFLLNNGDILLMGILLPLESSVDVGEIVRHVATTRLGGQHLGESSKWLEKAWLSLQSNPSYSVPTILKDARYFFFHKGHSHHELGLQYSGQDIYSIMAVVEQDQRLQETGAIGPLTAIKYYGKTWGVNTEVGLKFYFFKPSLSQPITLKPNIIEDVTFPYSLGWRYANPQRFALEVKLLQDYGCQVAALDLFEEGQNPCFKFVISKDDWDKTLVIKVAWNYPHGKIINAELIGDDTETVEIASTYTTLLSLVMEIARDGRTKDSSTITAHSN